MKGIELTLSVFNQNCRPLCRCNTTKQLIQYAHLHQTFWQVNDKEIFEQTGCLSKCNKYSYKAEPVDSFTKRDTVARFNNTLRLVLWFPTNEYESRKQVFEVSFNICHNKYHVSSIVHHLRRKCLLGRCWRIPGVASWPKFIWNI